MDFIYFNEFWFRIFVVLSFEVVWPRQPWRPRKEPSEYFQQLHFWNQFVPLNKMHYRVRYSLDLDLKIRSGQGCDLLLIFQPITKEILTPVQCWSVIDWKIVDYWYFCFTRFLADWHTKISQWAKKIFSAKILLGTIVSKK